MKKLFVLSFLISFTFIVGCGSARSNRIGKAQADLDKLIQEVDQNIHKLKKKQIEHSFREPQKTDRVCPAPQKGNFVTQTEPENLITQAFLKIDTGGHTGSVGDILVTCDQRYLVTAGQDKTVRVWETRTGKEVRKILGQIEPNKGSIYAIALSADDQTMAVSGDFANYEIRLYDFPTGKLKQILQSHSDSITDLSFSEDGRYLVSGSTDYTLKVWKKEGSNFALSKTFSDHSNRITGVRIFNKENEIHIVSASYDGTVRLYSLRDGLYKTFKTKVSKTELALNKQFIAVLGYNDKHIQILDHNLNLVHTITTVTIPKGLSFSPDNKLLLVGVRLGAGAHVFDTQTWQLRTFFQKHNPSQVTFLDNQTAVTAGGVNSDIYFWDTRTAQVFGKIAGNGNNVASAGVKENQIAFGKTLANKGKRNFEKSFDLNLYSISLVSILFIK